MAGLTGWHLVILIAVVVLLFGARRLPDMARAADQPGPRQPSAPSALAPAAEPEPASDRIHPSAP
jgi:sec-independent protein translocase protein TatA